MANFKQWMYIWMRRRKSSERPEFKSIKGGQEQVEVKVDQAFSVKGNRKLVRRQLGCKGALIVSVSGLKEEHGILTLLKAFSLLVNKKGSSKRVLLLITDCEEEDLDPDTNLPSNPELLKVLDGIGNNVKFFGKQSKERLATLYSAATVTIVPFQREQAVIDAQACGSPVITDRRIVSSIVVDGETGLLVTEDPEDLSLAMEAIMINEVMAKRMGKQAAIRMKRLAGQAVST